MDDPSMMHPDRVWVVFGVDSGVRAIGTTSVDAWRSFFDRAAATLDDLSRSLGHEDFRCVSCRLVPDDDVMWKDVEEAEIVGHDRA